MTSAKPRDGPATSFYADPFVGAIYRGESDYFDLVMHAGAPLLVEPEDLKAYGDFVQLVQNCLDPRDLEGDHPTAFFYEPDYLHVTIATLYPMEKQSSDVDYDEIKTYFKGLVEEASQRPEWPQKSLQLHLESAQLGSKAGILLWKEVTGAMSKIRECLVATENERLGSSWTIHSIPGIVHTTFLRFAEDPKTNGEVLQEQFQTTVLPVVPGIFDRTVSVSKAHLVCETTPYMRDKHAIWTIDLAK